MVGICTPWTPPHPARVVARPARAAARRRRGYPPRPAWAPPGGRLLVGTWWGHLVRPFRAPKRPPLRLLVASSLSRLSTPGAAALVDLARMAGPYAAPTARTAQFAKARRLCQTGAAKITAERPPTA